ELSVVGTRTSGGQDIWVTDLVRESSERKTFDDNLQVFAVWSKGGSRLAFHREQSGIYAIDVKASGKPKLLTETHGLPTSWSRRHLLYDSEQKIYLLDLANTKKPIQVGSANGHSAGGQCSPDGNYIAFQSDSSSRPEVYIQRLPPAAGETRVSING